MSYETSSEDREFITKLWGAEEVLTNSDLYCAKILHIRNGYQSSLHYHSVKDETFFALAGHIAVEYFPVGGVRCQTILSGKRRDGLHLPPGTAHRFWSMAGDAMLLEVSTFHSDTDVTRIEESCERP
jgi:D-lyxose ketol-isomerase